MGQFASIDKAIADIRAGKMVVVVDDAMRENEGDIVMAAEMVTPEAISFMAKKASGLICVQLPAEVAGRLGFESMVSEPREVKGCHFTVSVDASSDISTGISAADRANTIQKIASLHSAARDFVRPGHVFPLIAKSGGVLARAGHTEAACDLSRLAGFEPIGVICEIMLDGGEMAKGEELFAFAADYHLTIVSIQDLIAYRMSHESLVEKTADSTLPTEYGDFHMSVYRDAVEGREHVALVHGDIRDGFNILVRIHSECMTGDVFASNRCDCGHQLHEAMRRVSSEPCGAIIYLRHEGRGIGLTNKIKSYQLQDHGHDTVEANLLLGFADDERDYGFAAQILTHLGIHSIELLTNNPSKVRGIEAYGIPVTKVLPLEIVPTQLTHRYMKTKKEKMGHILKHV